MKVPSVRRCNVKKGVTVVGAFLLILPIGLPWYWGNMSVYALSYIAVRGETRTGIHTPWIISFYFLSNVIGFFLAGSLPDKLRVGKRPVLCLGVVLFAGGVGLTFLTVQLSVAMVTASVAFVAGVGGGVVNGLALQYAVAWAGGQDLGLVTAFVQSGFNFGPLLVNPLVTLYVNPDNLFPDKQIGRAKFFSQPEVLDKVPSFFLLFGACCVVVQFIGCVSVREFSDKPKRKEEENVSSDSSTDPPSSHKDTDTPDDDLPEKIINNYESSSPSKYEEVVQTVHDLSDTPKDSNSNSCTTDNNDNDITPKEMLRTRSFYVLCFILVSFDHVMLVVANYYKDYGAVWIADDHFLTFLGNVLTLATVVGFTCWGLISDRIGVKKTLMAMFSVTAWLCLAAYFTPMQHPENTRRWLYAANVLLLGFFTPPIYSVIIIATCQLFGKTHYSTNISYVNFLSFVANFVNPVVFQQLVLISWFYVFCFAACLSIVSLIVVALFLPAI